MHVLITGCSSGIGLATAIHFAKAGHQVLAGFRNPETAADLRKAVEEGLPITPVRIDVTDDASVAAGVASVLEQAGHIDVLVNNAGIGGSGPVELVPIERARQTFETNYFGAVRMMQAVLPEMRERRSGTIVNMTSMAGRIALGSHSHYCASKFALEGLTETLAAEVRPFGIRVLLIEPGVVQTPIFSKSKANPSAPTPYEMTVRRLRHLFRKGLQTPTMPETVAEVIERAVTADRPTLRYLVGKDAHTLLEGRKRLTDEEWIELQAMPDEEGFHERVRSLFGVDLYR
jgi:NAD(P)-dependent dehydrogenase (short-subunit alcohol dehydrogenase family)